MSTSVLQTKQRSYRCACLSVCGGMTGPWETRCSVPQVLPHQTERIVETQSLGTKIELQGLQQTRFRPRICAKMIVGVLTAQLHLGPIGSLKAKRSIVKSLLGRLKSRFNVSAAEVDHQDNKASAVVAMAIVSNDRSHIDQQFDAILAFMQKDGRFYLGQTNREIFNA